MIHGDVRIRPACPGDAAGVAAIYDHHVLHGTGTFEEEAPGAEAMAQRMADVAARGWPWLVAERGGEILGYAYAGWFKPRSGYRYSCEDSVYVAPGEAGRGLGGLLLAALMDAARSAGFRRMIAVIGDSGNAGSIRLHAAAGFRHVGLMEKVGYKFGRELDVVFMQRELG